MLINNFASVQEAFNSKLNGSTEDKSVQNTFKDVLEESLNKINDKQIEADNITNEFISGGDVEVHEMMLSMEEAKMSLQLAIQVRNKVVEAVKELTNMQL